MRSLVVLLSFAPLAARAGEIGTVRPCGVGMALGDPLGASLKCYVAGPVHAVELGLGADILGARAPGAELWAVYLVHPYDPWQSHALDVALHAGGGPVVGRLWKKPVAAGSDPPAAWGGVRLQLGADADLDRIPVQIALDLGIDLVIRPEVQVDPVAVLGVRYFL
jgi:hypothetical protein